MLGHFAVSILPISIFGPLSFIVFIYRILLDFAQLLTRQAQSAGGL